MINLQNMMHCYRPDHPSSGLLIFHMLYKLSLLLNQIFLLLASAEETTWKGVVV